MEKNGTKVFKTIAKDQDQEEIVILQRYHPRLCKAEKCLLNSDYLFTVSEESDRKTYESQTEFECFQHV